ncbi:MAG: 16S rRNA (guanine(966)-N(2))-methyltransferase RsmD [Nannocystaceae bacterium]|nr:16S rRNA (guanine(966)-N(2))-methyltransferase RsmD [Myxococcales bacterium]
MRRVGGGRLGGRRLLSLPASVRGVRPTGSRVREAIADRLQRELPGAHVLDLFAGTGGLAIEVLSRGAASAVLVEQQPRVARFLREQLTALELGAVARVVCADARRYLEGSVVAPFELVLLDPPYDAEGAQALVSTVVAALAGGGWLRDGAVVVHEYGRERGRGGVVRWPAGFQLERTRSYGQSAVDFLRWRGDP